MPCILEQKPVSISCIIPAIKTTTKTLKRDSDGTLPRKKYHLTEMFNGIKAHHGDTISEYKDLNHKINGV